MSEEKIELRSEDVAAEDKTTDETAEDNGSGFETPSDAQAEFSENYRKLPMWKQVVLLVLFLGGITAVIMLINFIVEFGGEMIKALLGTH